ncbi:MAG: TRIC cation channel family protein [Angelakisella sp.]
MNTLTGTLFTVLEAVGAVAFAVSGATVALQRRLDVFGVMLLGLTTALGGGCIRDLLLGRAPAGHVQSAALCHCGHCYLAYRVPAGVVLAHRLFWPYGPHRPCQ